VNAREFHIFAAHSPQQKKSRQMSSSRSPAGRAAHNKSNRHGLSICEAVEALVEACLRVIAARAVPTVRLSRTACLFLERPSDGRFTQGQVKYFYIYQAVARRKFGRSVMATVMASKAGTDLTISHVCGSRFCLNGTHMVLEAKQVNDKRVHCHVFLAYVTDASKRHVLAQDHCPHSPKCYSV